MAIPGSKGHRRVRSTESLLSDVSFNPIDVRGARAKWGAELGDCFGNCIRCQWCRQRCCPREEGDEGCFSCEACGAKAEADHASPRWRHELGECLEHKSVYRPITALLLIDVGFIFAEFIIHDYHFIDMDWPHEVGYYIKCTSLSILVIFQIESILTLIAFGLKFFSNPGFILDAIVIPVSILMETVLTADGASLLVVLRFWRLVRIAHGIYEAQMVQLRQTQQELMKHKIVISDRAPHLHHHVENFDESYKGGLTQTEKLGISTMRMENNPLANSKTFRNRHSEKSMGDLAIDGEEAEAHGRPGPEKGTPSPTKKRRTAKSRASDSEITAIPSTNTTE